MSDHTQEEMNMGFDISYHPICHEQMEAWYFSLLGDVSCNDFTKLHEIGKTEQIDAFYIDKYIDTMKVAANTQADEWFEKTHVYYLAVVHGLFRLYYYTRGTAFSFLIDQVPQMAQYTTSWQQIKPASISCPIIDKLSENYSGGIYIAPEQVKKLLIDYQENGDIHKIISDFFEQNTPIFLKALQYAFEHELGLLEASEVVEPNPTDLNKTTSYSNLMNCDKEGVFIYRDTALKQIEEFMRAQGNTSSPEAALDTATYNTESIPNKKKSKGLFAKLFKK